VGKNSQMNELYTKVSSSPHRKNQNEASAKLLQVYFFSKRNNKKVLKDFELIEVSAKKNYRSKISKKLRFIRKKESNTFKVLCKFNDLSFYKNKQSVSSDEAVLGVGQRMLIDSPSMSIVVKIIPKVYVYEDIKERFSFFRNKKLWYVASAQFVLLFLLFYLSFPTIVSLDDKKAVEKPIVVQILQPKKEVKKIKKEAEQKKLPQVVENKQKKVVEKKVKPKKRIVKKSKKIKKANFQKKASSSSFRARESSPKSYSKKKRNPVKDTLLGRLAKSSGTQNTVSAAELLSRGQNSKLLSSDSKKARQSISTAANSIGLRQSGTGGQLGQGLKAAQGKIDAEGLSVGAGKSKLKTNYKGNVSSYGRSRGKGAFGSSSAGTGYGTLSLKGDGHGYSELSTSLGRYRGPVKKCFVRFASESRYGAIKVVYSWFVSAKGRVSEIRQVSKTNASSALSQCLRMVIEQMRFPGSKKARGTRVTKSFIST